jgi:hypothetical protein
MPPPEKTCASIKSRKHKNIQCPFQATHGDFCHRHYKNPQRFLKKEAECSHVHTRSEHSSAKRIQIFWRAQIQMYKKRLFGPAFYHRALSSNDTEISTFEPIEKIPQIYLFSYLDSKGICWTFDLRSLNHLLLEDTALKNPYTREPLEESTRERLTLCNEFLKRRGISCFYNMQENLNQKQMWNQRVLDFFLKLDNLGYRGSTHWFDGMTLLQQEKLYRRLYTLWNYRLGLTPQEKETIIPGHLSNATKLFRWTPDTVENHNHDLHWWKKNNLELLLKFISSTRDKSKQGLGALYVLMGFASIVREVGDAYPWILETV